MAVHSSTLSSFFVAIVVLVSLATPALSCETRCRFNLCSPSPLSLRPPNDTAVTSPICLSGGVVGVVHTGEAHIRRRNGFVRISKFGGGGSGDEGLLQAYSASFFKTFSLRNGTRSGIGHETPQQNQADGFLDDKCVALPVTEYQQVERQNGTLVVVDNVKLEGRPLVDCVSFRVGEQ